MTSSASGCFLFLLFLLLAAVVGFGGYAAGYPAAPAAGVVLVALGWLVYRATNRVIGARRQVYDRWHYDTVMAVRRMETGAINGYYCGDIGWPECVRQLGAAADLARGLEDYTPLYDDFVRDGTIGGWRR